MLIEICFFVSAGAADPDIYSDGFEQIDNCNIKL